MTEKQSVDTTTPKQSVSAPSCALLAIFVDIILVLLAILVIGATLFGATSIFAMLGEVPEFARTGVIMKGLSTIVGFLFFLLIPGIILGRIGAGLWAGQWERPVKFTFFATCLFLISSVACGFFMSLLLDPLSYMPVELYVSLPRMFEMSGQVLGSWITALAFSGIVSAFALWAGRKIWNTRRQDKIPA